MKKIELVLSVCCFAGLLLYSGCVPNHRGRASIPDPTPTLIPLTETERAKIDPELLTVIEWEEQHPGEGRDMAPDDFIFNSRDQVMCIVELNNDKVEITLGSESRESDLEIIREVMTEYGGAVIYESEYSNTISIQILLGDVKNLTKEELVVGIRPDRNVQLVPIMYP